jgi:hypothetical protein
MTRRVSEAAEDVAMSVRRSPIEPRPWENGGHSGPALNVSTGSLAPDEKVPTDDRSASRSAPMARFW